jgi:hypothetical protein
MSQQARQRNPIFYRHPHGGQTLRLLVRQGIHGVSLTTWLLGFRYSRFDPAHKHACERAAGYGSYRICSGLGNDRAEGKFGSISLRKQARNKLWVGG